MQILRPIGDKHDPENAAPARRTTTAPLLQLPLPTTCKANDSKAASTCQQEIGRDAPRRAAKCSWQHFQLSALPCQPDPRLSSEVRTASPKQVLTCHPASSHVESRLLPTSWAPAHLLKECCRHAGLREEAKAHPHKPREHRAPLKHDAGVSACSGAQQRSLQTVHFAETRMQCKRQARLRQVHTRHIPYVFRETTHTRHGLQGEPYWKGSSRHCWKSTEAQGATCTPGSIG